LTEKNITEIISRFKDPVLNKDFGNLNFIKNVQLNDNNIKINLGITNLQDDSLEKLTAELTKAIKSETGFSGDIDIKYTAGILNHNDKRKENVMPGVKNTIAIASGKGGVGKSTIAVNLAAALTMLDVKVGLIDADIYGPSIPIMLGINKRPEVTKIDGKARLLPVIQYGIKLMSIGFLTQGDEAIVWRGPMASSALKQFMSDVSWDELDILLFDMPPGTGDIQLTLSQTIPLTGAVIITTPQDISLSDAKKGHNMFQKVNVPTLGVIENMSYFVNPDNTKEYIFGKGGGAKMSKEYNVNLLGEIPIATKIREYGDAGMPIVISEPDCDISGIYRSISLELIKQININNSTEKPNLEILI